MHTQHAPVSQHVPVMSSQPAPQPDLGYLDLQAAVGVTKHTGGFPATRTLLARCHVAQVQRMLYVGSGIGVGPTWIARTYGCRVMAVDISPAMIAWSLRRAVEEKVTDRVEFQVADVLALPFAGNSFDTVLCESVLAFVEDKATAIRECVRVTRPGGYVGLNESVWLEEPSPAVAVYGRSLGTSIPVTAGWQALWEQSGLDHRTADIYTVDAGAEIRSRIQWIGWRWMLRAWGRVLRLYVTNPQVRDSIRGQLDVPREVWRLMGYGLFSGQK